MGEQQKGEGKRGLLVGYASRKKGNQVVGNAPIRTNEPGRVREGGSGGEITFCSEVARG